MKAYCFEIGVHCSEGSFIRNRGSVLRRFIIPKVQYSEIDIIEIPITFDLLEDFSFQKQRITNI